MKTIVNVNIDGKDVSVPSDFSILKAAETAGVQIPRLCFIEGIHEESSCRVCVVEIEGMGTLKNSCAVKVTEGMRVKTNTKRVKDSVRQNLELTAANHVFECWVCPREHNCEFLDLLRKNNVSNKIGEDPKFSRRERVYRDDSVAIVLDSGKCTLCGRCISSCEKQASTKVLAFNNRGSAVIVGPAQGTSMEDAGCIYCGKCLQACPVAAIKEKDHTQDVYDALADPDTFVVVQAAPSVRAALGEEFGFPMGTNVEGKMYEAFRLMGFDDIADTNYGADLTIMEEGNEFIERLKNNGPFPQFTSCSPGWVRYLETYNPELIHHFSSAKSPHQMLGAIAKHYYADKLGIDKKKMYTVSVMPCIAKKYESSREEMKVDGLRDVDCVITTRELARMIKLKGIDFKTLDDHVPTSEMAQFTGAGVLFGATGGVMEAALRTVVEKVSGRQLDKIDFLSVRGTKDIKEATLTVDGTDLNVAVVHGGSAIKEFIAHMKTSEKQYHFVEFMGCTGGCINGGGQPVISAKTMETVDYRTLRASVLYNEDMALTVRKSHESPAMIKLYDEFLGAPGSHLAHKLLHTTFSKKEMYVTKK